MSIDDEIARFEWSRIPTYLGHAEMVPGAVRSLVAAANEEEAARLGGWMERILLSVAGPCEGCAPVATVLVAALPEMTPAGHSVALDLLSVIGAAEVTGPSHEQIGAVDVDEIRRAVTAGFPHYVAVLQAESSAEGELHSCIDLVGIAALYDPRLAAAGTAALTAIRTSGRGEDLAALIENALADLENPPWEA
ncbi:hypothetical protein ACFFMM_28895 [Micromonospora chaiyaphumensis]|uniref:Uncharacterized protein n=1 Tax=Micromonospora chaiyaphumensis TaxID=307119 RepID=A0A1C4Z4G4_9ACTN|nr:hypothetical protein [Micromonospora chaiyaphumensis]SCF27858.1 hypothetical protein GA0070214_111172 [Micromonospora chaiyaphumensis]